MELIVQSKCVNKISETNGFNGYAGRTNYEFNMGIECHKYVVHNNIEHTVTPYYIPINEDNRLDHSNYHQVESHNAVHIDGKDLLVLTNCKNVDFTYEVDLLGGYKPTPGLVCYDFVEL